MGKLVFLIQFQSKAHQREIRHCCWFFSKEPYHQLHVWCSPLNFNHTLLTFSPMVKERSRKTQNESWNWAIQQLWRINFEYLRSKSSLSFCANLYHSNRIFPSISSLVLLVLMFTVSHSDGITLSIFQRYKFSSSKSRHIFAIVQASIFLDWFDFTNLWIFDHSFL